MSTGVGVVRNGRFRALVRKEFRQILRDRQLVRSLVLAPLLFLCLWGFVLDVTVADLNLGVVDESQTPESRELVAVLTQSRSFRLAGTYLSVGQLEDAISRGRIDAAVVIPHEYSRNLFRGRPTQVQFFLNAMNVNTAQISQGYALGVVQSYNARLAGRGIQLAMQQIGTPAATHRSVVTLNPVFFYNPGLVSTWFALTGVVGILLITFGSSIVSTVMLKEREAGTIEQLLISPANTSELILAKIAPLFILLSVTGLLALGLIRFVFSVPIHGSLLLALGGAALCVLSGIAVGTLIATYAKSTLQAQLMVFFVNPPLNLLSAAFMPIEAMPQWLQPLTLINPIYHFGRIARGTLIRGSGFDTLWPNFLVLFAFTVVFLFLSVRRFRRQLS